MDRHTYNKHHRQPSYRTIITTTATKSICACISGMHPSEVTSFVRMPAANLFSIEKLFVSI